MKYRMKRKPEITSCVFPRIFRYVWIIGSMGYLIGTGGCCREGFTPEEKQIICSREGKIMRLYTVDNGEDSLLLRRQALALTPEMLQAEEYRLLKAGMLATVRDTANAGVGIAAPQVGVSRQLIAVQRFDKAGEPFEFYINPEIVQYSEEKQWGPEGCLSIPGARDSVMRSERIVVSYIDEVTRRVCRDTVKGFTAVVFQHEIDHLKGILFTDKAVKK